MSIVINGSGSISGISVGGLPDGSVDAGTVAADVATQAEIDAKLNLAGGTVTGNITHNDNVQSKWGTSGDFSIRHTGSHTYIQDAGDGDLIIKSNGTDVKIIGDNDENVARFTWNDGVDLYFNNSKKIETTATGVAVTGKITGAVGSVLQVVQAVKTDTFTTTSSNFVDITGVTQAVTPSASSSKVLVTATLNIGNSHGSGHMVQVRLLRGSTVIALGDAAGNRQRVFAVGQIHASNANQNNVSVNFLDSPSTASAVTYKVQIITEGQTATVNRSGIDGDVVYAGRTISTITLQEIGA